MSIGGGEMLIGAPDGDLTDFHNRFIEEDVLGEGEFGVVKRVFETSNSNVPLACKTLKKGMVFKDNQLYPALPPARFWNVFYNGCLPVLKLN